MDDALKDVQERIHHRFRQVKLLRTALTQSSYANEHGGVLENNERLEFLGDAVLELCVSEELYARFPHVREGELTRMRSKLVSKPTLAGLARELGLDEFMLLGKGEEGQGGRTRKSLMADALEAVLGAVFLDQGFEGARQWVRKVFEEHWPLTPVASVSKDYKSELQEETQRRYKDRPVYTLEHSNGPDHAKVFEVKLTLPTGETLTAKAGSVKKAEQKAAGRALVMLREEEEE